jgi:hypothetical protein
VEMLGGGNRGWGVGNEPSRSLRGSGVVARLLRSELSAEHFLSRLERHSHRSRTREIRAGASGKRAPSPRAIRPAVEPRAGFARLVRPLNAINAPFTPASRAERGSPGPHLSSGSLACSGRVTASPEAGPGAW